MFRRKWNRVRRLATTNDVTVLQEVHGDDVQLRSTLCRLACSHHVFWSAAPDAAAGGVATLLRRSSFPDLPISNEVILAGRIMRTTVQFVDRHLCFVNMHNFQVSQTIIARLASDAARSAATTFWAGDWNFPPEGSPTLRLGRSRTTIASRDSCERRRWRPLLRHLTEIVHNRSTRFAWRLRGTPQEEFLQSSLDWVAVSLPATALARTTITSQVYPPDIGHTADEPTPGASPPPTPLSDHVPVITTFETRHPKPPTARPIP